MEHFTLNLSIGKARRVVEDGVAYIVVPMTTITKNGVLPGSRGPLLYPHRETINSVPEWDGTPIVVYHPQKHGRHCSAMEVPEQHVGELRRSGINDRGHLSHEGWLREDRLKLADARQRQQSRPEIMPAIFNGQPVEVSTGLYTTNVPRHGVSPHGRPYTAIATDFRPDHLAILPDQIGACSINDGCGMLVNAKDKKGEPDCPT